MLQVNDSSSLAADNRLTLESELMLFEVKNLAADTGPLAALLRRHDVNAKVTGDVATGQIDVAAQMTSGQVIDVLQQAGYEASRLSEPQQIHISGGSTCCGSCS